MRKRSHVRVKIFAAALLVAVIAKQVHNLQHHYTVQAVETPVSPSSAPLMDGIDNSSDKTRLQRQKSRPTNNKLSTPSQQQQQQHYKKDENEDQIHLQQKQQNSMKHMSQHTAKSEYESYMHWVEAVLGIRSVVEIKEFEYIDHLQILWQKNEIEVFAAESNNFEWLQKYSVSELGDQNSSAKKEVPTKMVRGLAAKHDISVGDIVMSIPLYSLLSVSSTIDHDPVLSRILGPKARDQYGWTDASEYEVPLLVIALLYHRSLGMESPLAHYIDVLLATPTDFPILWSNQELQMNVQKLGSEVMKLARGIQKDMHDMYDKIMGKLVIEHSDLFSPPNDDSLEGWMYSYKEFQWAFALVISRHHYLPIQDLDYGDAISQTSHRSKRRVQTIPQHKTETVQLDSSVLEVVPPANQPTDSWVELAKNEEKVTDDSGVEDDEIDVPVDDDDVIAPSGFFKHSFLAPLADMFNFGPPCLTGSYNSDEHVFELIATCSFKAGQEVTFYYSSECADVIIANYAFIHPLVPPCATLDEVNEKSEGWRSQAMDVEEKLLKARHQVDVLVDEILELESRLQSCESGEGVNEELQHSMPALNEGIKSYGVGDETTFEAERAPSQQKLRKEGPSRNHEVGVRGRIQEPSHEEFDEKIMEELG